MCIFCYNQTANIIIKLMYKKTTVLIGNLSFSNLLTNSDNLLKIVIIIYITIIV